MWHWNIIFIWGLKYGYKLRLLLPYSQQSGGREFSWWFYISAYSEGLWELWIICVMWSTCLKLLLESLHPQLLVLSVSFAITAFHCMCHGYVIFLHFPPLHLCLNKHKDWNSALQKQVHYSYGVKMVTLEETINSPFMFPNNIRCFLTNMYI